MNRFLFILILCTLAMASCKLRGDDRQEEEPDAEPRTELHYSVNKGQRLFQSGALRLQFWQTPFRFPMTLKFYMGEDVQYPEVEEEDGPHVADMFTVCITGRSSRSGQFLEKDLCDKTFLRGGILELVDVSLYPEDFRNLKAGKDTLVFTVEGDFVTIHGTPSGKKPLDVEFSVAVDVPEVHLTRFHFEELKLDLERATEILGSNDFSNGTPETGISIFLNGENLFYAFTKNSDYLIRPTDIDIYHFNVDDELEIEVLDVDYGFNRDDLISKIRLPLTELESDSPLYYDFDGVEKLHVRAKGMGVVNLGE